MGLARLGGGGCGLPWGVPEAVEPGCPPSQETGAAGSARVLLFLGPGHHTLLRGAPGEGSWGAAAVHGPAWDTR